ncbi:hypothetical protein S40293_11488 [Stachybotrys chartarum IBT 40293]|nr:hypothetical protein S40293_11488 [Stachybotrys chartarum IBT 40293]
MVSILIAIISAIIMASTHSVLASPQWIPDCTELDIDAFLAIPKIDVPLAGPDGLYARSEEDESRYSSWIVHTIMSSFTSARSVKSLSSNDKPSVDKRVVAWEEAAASIADVGM